MKTVAAVFNTRATAEQGVAELQSLGVSQDRITLLTSQSTPEELARVPKSDSEQPGIVKELGAVVGSMAGFAGGFGLVALALPGIGPIFAFGVAGGLLLGAIGGVTGEIAGKSLDNALSDGLPTDELFFYEDALRDGRSVVVVLPDAGVTPEAARAALEKAGAESIDRAREKWWMGLRDVEKEHYEPEGAGSEGRELWFRRGFEAALDPVNRGKSYQDSRSAHQTRYPDLYDEEAEKRFRRGYERGQAYLQAKRSNQTVAKTV